MASSNGGDEMTDKRDVRSKIAMFECFKKPTETPKHMRPPTIISSITKTEPNIEGSLQRPKEESVETTNSEGNKDHKVSTSGRNELDVLPTIDTGNQASNVARQGVTDEPLSKTELSEEQKRLKATLNIELYEKNKETLLKAGRQWSPNEMEVFNKPMCLISTDDSGNTLKIEKDTLAQISRIDWPLCVVSIAGLYRTGKSFLMNRLAGKTEGFALGDTIESKTKGIWVWCRIHPNVEKKNTVLVLLDTEGLGDIEKGDPNHDNKIFTIAVLLCNTLVYNMKGAFDHDAVAKLTFVTEMSQNIRFGDENGDENEKLKLVLPSFVLCLRDFSLKLYKTNKGSITEDEYLEDCLQLSKKKGDAFNKPRECIRKFFPDRKCFVMPVPGDADILENLESLEFEALSPRFKAATERFVKNIYTRGTKELLVSKPINGAMFATLAESYINALANGAIPDVDDAFTAVAKLENARVQTIALELFRRKMESIDLPVPSKKLEGIYTEAQSVALDYFRENAVHDFIDRASEKETEMVMKSTWNEVSAKNTNLIRSKCQEILQCKGEKFRRNIRSQKYYIAGGYCKYKEDIEKFRQTYMSELKGYDEQEVLMSWMTFQQSMGETDNKILQKDTEISEEEKETQRLQNEKQMRDMQEQHKQQLDAKLAAQKKEQNEREEANERKRQKQLKDEKDRYDALKHDMLKQQNELEEANERKRQQQLKDQKDRYDAIEHALLKQQKQLQSKLDSKEQDMEAERIRRQNMGILDRVKAVFTGYD